MYCLSVLPSVYGDLLGRAARPLVRSSSSSRKPSVRINGHYIDIDAALTLARQRARTANAVKPTEDAGFATADTPGTDATTDADADAMTMHHITLLLTFHPVMLMLMLLPSSA
jgi:hypothetical protein